MIEQILVPTDFSPCADNAAEVAIRVAAKTHAKIRFLHVLSLPVDWLNLPKNIEEQYPQIQALIGEANDTLNKWVEKAKKQGVEALKNLSFTESYSEIAGTVNDSEKDLIIIGSHGQTGYQKFTLGSTAQRIMRRAKVPVLVVQDDATKLTFDTIVYASGLEKDTMPAYERVIKMANEMGTEKLHFLEVTTPYNFKTTKETVNQMKQFTAKHPFDGMKMHMINHHNIETGILEFAQDHSAGLLAIATHGRSDLSSLFVDSIPENLVKFASFPVLSIRV